MASPTGRRDETAPPARGTVTVGLLADEGTPTRIATALAEQLCNVLSRRLSSRVEWQVQARSEQLSLDEDGQIPVDEFADERRAAYGWDVLVLLTDLPRRAGTQPIVSDFNAAQGVALLSVPALGAVRLKARTQNLLVHLLGHLLEERLGLDPELVRHAPGGRLPGRVSDVVLPMRHVDSEDGRVDQHLALRGVRGRQRLLLGMVRTNRPWRLVPHLAGATAAASATAAYGVITSSFWLLADALSVWRLCVINLVAIMGMAAWLLYYNGLWDRPRDFEPREKAVLYNASTVLTLLLSVTCMYVILFVVALLAAAAAIDSGYLQSQLKHPVGLRQYATIVWLASSVGIVAGALGSSFDSEHAVRKATYSKREQDRKREYDKDDNGSGGSTGSGTQA